MADDWQTLTSLAETNLKMLELEIMFDVTFLVGNEKQPIRAHKYMLVSRSPVFYAMFCGPMAEARDSIEVPDLEVECFEGMLRFIYTTDCLITADIVMSLLYVAKKYEIVGLVNKCKVYLKSEMSTENVCVILQQAHVFDEQDLLKQCLYFICKNATTILKSEDFLCLSKDTLRIILASDELDAQEDNVYLSCVKWAEEECKRLEKSINYTNSRKVLGDLVYLIRFPCMTLDTFTPLMADGGLLTGDENMSVVLQLTQNRKSKFNNKPRKHFERLDNVLISRFTDYKTGWLQNGPTAAISFTCNTNLCLAGVSLYTPCMSGDVKGKLECYENDSCITSIDIELAYDSNITFVKELFDISICLQKDATYTLTQTVRGTNMHSGYGGQESTNMHSGYGGQESTNMHSGYGGQNSTNMHSGYGGQKSVKIKDNIEIRFFNSNKDTNGTSVAIGMFHGLFFL